MFRNISKLDEVYLDFEDIFVLVNVELQSGDLICYEEWKLGYDVMYIHLKVLVNLVDGFNFQTHFSFISSRFGQ